MGKCTEGRRKLRNTVCKSEDSIVGDFDSIPLIDIRGIFSEKLEDRAKVAAELREACIKLDFST